MPTLTFTKSQLGPIVDVTVKPSPAGFAQLKKAGFGIPQPINLKMLVDTGSDTCALEEEIATSFHLPYVSAAFAMSFGKSTPIRRYEFSLTLTGANGESWESPPLIVAARTSPFTDWPYRGLIGRDVLDQCVFTCDGPRSLCRLEFDA